MMNVFLKPFSINIQNRIFAMPNHLSDCTNNKNIVFSVNGRVTVDDPKEEVSNLILDVKPITNETSIVKNEDVRNNTDDNSINANLIFDVKANATEASIVTNRDEQNNTNDNLINANFILNAKANATEASIVTNRDEQNNTNDNLINANFILYAKANATEGSIVTNRDEQNTTNDNLINASFVLDVKADATEASIVTNRDERTNSSDNVIRVNLPVATEPTTIVKNQDVRTNVSDNFINATFTKDSTTTTEERTCITEKEILNNLLSPDYNVSYIMKNLCKSTFNSFKTGTGKALLLTDYIKKGKTKEGRTASKVDSNLFLGIKSYSGFFTVNETYNSNIFFWYFPVLNLNVSESPWIIWLQGGPGASSLTGLFDEIGPFTVANNSLKLNPYTWLQNHSLLFIDNPVGTGYSFTEHEAGYVTDMTGYTNHLYSTLVQFLQVFPELKGVPLYIAGESYAGKYVPAMGMEIYRRNQTKENPDINLQGLIVGNAYVDPEMISHLVWPFYYFGLLDKQQVELVKPLLDSFQENIKANRSIEAKEKWNSLITVVLFMTHQRHAYNFLDDEVPMGRYIGFLRSTKIKKAIHVGDIKFGFVNMTVNAKLAPDFLSTTKPFFETLLEHYKVLAYCGQLDQMLPCVFTSENYRTWKWNGTDEFIRATRLPYMYNNKLAGYIKSGGRFTEVVVRGAGHMVPLDKPAPTQNLVTRWTHDKALSVRFTLLQSSFIEDYVRNKSMTIYL